MKLRHCETNSKIRTKFLTCQSLSHYTALCKKDVKEKVKDDNRNSLDNSKVDKQEDQHIFLVLHNQRVLLQAAKGIAKNIDESKSKIIHIMFDTCSQRSCI